MSEQKFRKKPVVIEAVQFKAADMSTQRHVNFGTPDPIAEPNLVERWWVHTLEGPLFVTENDWIITGVKGEHYPCKPDIFAATYTKADDREMDDADRALIAEAPDLLAAAQAALDWRGLDGDGLSDPVRHQLLAATAKARP